MMTYRRSEASRGNVPTRAEDQEIHQRNVGLLGFGGEDTKDGRVDVVLGDASYVDEFLECILVGNVANTDGQSQSQALEMN